MIREIPKYEGLYWASFDGNIHTKNWRNTGKDAVLKPAKDKKGYLRVGLMKDGKLITEKVHRLIALTFIPNPDNLPQINHKDGNKLNNYIGNLEWCTAKHNMKHAYDNGLSFRMSPVNKIPKKGELNGQSILKDWQVLQIRRRFIPRKVTRKQLALDYNVSEACIKDIILHKSWKHI